MAALTVKSHENGLDPRRIIIAISEPLNNSDKTNRKKKFSLRISNYAPIIVYSVNESFIRRYSRMIVRIPYYKQMETKAWDCSKCSHINEPLMQFCTDCGESRRKTENVSMECTYYKGWACDSCTFINKEHLKICEICHSPRTHVTDVKVDSWSQSQNEWDCMACTFRNKKNKRCCEVCNRDRSNPRSVLHLDEAMPIEAVRIEPADGISTNERRLVLLGKTGTGKSATGNNVLGFRQFESGMCGKSITKVCKIGEAVRFEKSILLVDTPGLFDTGLSNKDSTKEIIKCIGMTAPGPHAFILVVQAGRFTQEEQHTVDHFVEHFGEDMYRHLIVLFTRKDGLEKEGKTIHDFVHTAPSALTNILTKCKNRYVSFNNTADTQTKKDEDVKTLLEMVENVLQENNGQCYTNEMYKEAEKALRRRMEMIRKEEEEKRENEKRKQHKEIVEKYESEMASLGQYLETVERKLQNKEMKSSSQSQIDEIKADMELLRQKRDIEVEQMADERHITNLYLRKMAREQSEKGSISLILEGFKNIGSGLALPFKKIFS